MKRAREAVVKNMELAIQRDKDAIASIVEGLLLAGIAMSFSGVSRPASGLEHCFSHIWEMMALERNRPYDLHGIQVGIGTALASKALSALRELLLDPENIKNTPPLFNQEAWEANVRRVFPGTADSLIESAKLGGRNDQNARQKRANIIMENREQILKIMDEELAPLEEIVKKMEAFGIPTHPSEIEISNRDTIDAFVCSRDIRNRYLSTSMMWDIGVLDCIADSMERNLKGKNLM